MESIRFRTVLRTLVDHGVEFIVVGGVAAVLVGAPINTFDLDIVHSRDPENIARLLAALRELEACYRHHPQRPTPSESHLASDGHQLLMTRYGPLDVLGKIGKGWAYPDLLPHSCVQELSADLRLRVLDLETQIVIKEETDRDKDRATLLILRAVLDETRKK